MEVSMVRRFSFMAAGLLLLALLLFALNTSTAATATTSGTLTGWDGNAMLGASYTMLQLDASTTNPKLTVQFSGIGSMADAYCGVTSGVHYPPTAQDQYAWAPKWGWDMTHAQGTTTVTLGCTTKAIPRRGDGRGFPDALGSRCSDKHAGCRDGDSSGINGDHRAADSHDNPFHGDERAVDSHDRSINRDNGSFDRDSHDRSINGDDDPADCHNGSVNRNHATDDRDRDWSDRDADSGRRRFDLRKLGRRKCRSKWHFGGRVGTRQAHIMRWSGIRERR